MSAASAPLVTTATDARLVVLFDGNCRFCTGTAKKIARRFGAERVLARNFQDEGVLGEYPGVTYDACMKKMHVVAPDGRVYAGAAALARLLRTLRFVGFVAYLYYIPGVRQLSELLYALIAKYRYKLFGRTEVCDGGTCHLHE